MLARQTDKPFDDDNWIFEIKWNGLRAISIIKDGRVTLYSRNGQNLNEAYPSLISPLKNLNHDAVIDGEIVVTDKNGKSDFDKFQQYQIGINDNFNYYAFDLLALNGRDITHLPLLQRKELLHKLLRPQSIIKFSDHIASKGIMFFNLCNTNGHEEIIAKKSKSLYHSGKRTADWLKIKKYKTKELVIVGFSPALGLRKDTCILYLAAKTTSGYIYECEIQIVNDKKLVEIFYQKLIPIKTKKNPITEKLQTSNQITWVKPIFVCEVRFNQLTADGKMQDPVFLYLREDKTAADIEIEVEPVIRAKQISGNQAVVHDEELLVFWKKKVQLTNRNKILWQGEGITKGMMIDYYQKMADFILPHLKHRLLRVSYSPSGAMDNDDDNNFIFDEIPTWTKWYNVHSKKDSNIKEYILCDNKASLAYINNLGCVELNTLQVTRQNVHNPDYLIIELIPSSKNVIDEVVEVANIINQLLNKTSASNYCKTAGYNGLHIFIPLQKKYPYKKVALLAKTICQRVQAELPGITSFDKSENKIFLNHFQNVSKSACTAVYSLSHQSGALVSTPLLWREVKPGLNPAEFNFETVYGRVKKMKDIFKPVLEKGEDLERLLRVLG